eukprot:TRINITY_DN35437_c0_g1_i1.p1 TRINITY_DN35437_c0_g1~~TRINITY_DN35437_c0_g1_i1.p1  ORF type:complete len:304 (-),score=53.62 TRINITY_DN35437_c0_g1_i1:132-1043(-)
MMRLLRIVPELLIMVKAILAATRTVCFTLALLLIVVYVFAIAFKQILKGTDVGDELFSSMTLSMHTLIMHGAFLDSISDVMNAMRKESYLAFALMYVEVIASAVTIMNMLIGVLCEVISAVAAAEKEAIQVRWVRQAIYEVLTEEVDANDDGMVDETEFLAMLTNNKALEALKEIDVDISTLLDFVDVIFEDATEETADGVKMMPFPDFMSVLLQLRGSNTATVKDLVDLRKWFTAKFSDHGGEAPGVRLTGQAQKKPQLEEVASYELQGKLKEPHPPAHESPPCLPGQPANVLELQQKTLGG